MRSHMRTVAVRRVWAAATIAGSRLRPGRGSRKCEPCPFQTGPFACPRLHLVRSSPRRDGAVQPMFGCPCTAAGIVRAGAPAWRRQGDWGHRQKGPGDTAEPCSAMGGLPTGIHDPLPRTVRGQGALCGIAGPKCAACWGTDKPAARRTAAQHQPTQPRAKGAGRLDSGRLDVGAQAPQLVKERRVRD